MDWFILLGLLVILIVLICWVVFGNQRVWSQPRAIGVLSVGITPAGLAITPNNVYAYVANNNNYGITGGQDSVTVLDLKHSVVKTRITDVSFNQPYTVTINKKGTLAYVTNSNSTTITIIDITTNTVNGVIDGFDGPSGLVIDPLNSSLAYVNNYGGPEGVGSGNGTTVSIVDLDTNTITGTITVGLAPAALAISIDGSTLYVANYVDGNDETGTISVVSTASNTVIHTITGFSGPFAIIVSHSGKHAYVTNFGSNNFTPFGNTVSVIKLSTNTITDTITVGIQASGLAITPDDKLLFVSNYNTLYAGPSFTDLTAGQGTVNVISTKTKHVIATIPVGQSPSAIAITSSGKHALVSNFTSGTIDIIKI